MQCFSAFPRSRAAARVGIALLCALLAPACLSWGPQGTPRVIRPELPLLPVGESSATEALFESSHTSCYVTTLDGTLAPHYHERHEEVVWVLTGRARMFVGNTWYEIGPGDVVHLPAGVLHAVETDRPCSVISLFSPPFDGVDRVYLDELQLPPSVPPPAGSTP